MTKYTSQDRITPEFVQSIFKNRSDKLWRRDEFPLEERKHEMFLAREKASKDESAKAVKDKIEEKSRGVITKITYKFYPGARPDGMIEREEFVKQKVIERYQGRDDFRIYRSIRVDANMDNKQPSKHLKLNINGKPPEMPIRKITEKFARDPSKNAEDDVRKRVHFIAEGTIRLSFHYGARNIDFSDVLMDKADKDKLDVPDDTDPRLQRRSRSDNKRVDRDWKPPSKAEKKEFLTEQREMEKWVYSDIKDREEMDMKDLVARLETERDHVVCERTIYDIAAETSDKAEQDEVEQKGNDEKNLKPDILRPHLASYVVGETLKYDQAMQVKEECLNALKERLLERTIIIQEHFQRETRILAQSQSSQRPRVSTPGDAEEKSVEQGEQAMFKIQILQDRLHRHERQAVIRYFDMVRELDADPRLAVLQKRTPAISEN
jgi:hypothetical protein